MYEWPEGTITRREDLQGLIDAHNKTLSDEVISRSEKSARNPNYRTPDNLAHSSIIQGECP